MISKVYLDKILSIVADYYNHEQNYHKYSMGVQEGPKDDSPRTTPELPRADQSPASGPPPGITCCELPIS